MKNITAYLAGAVELHNTPENWRQQITPKLQKLHIEVHNPLIKPPWMPQIDGKKQKNMKQKLLHENTTPIEMRTIRENNHSIRKYCLALVRTSDIIIAKIDKTPTVGTYEELNYAKDKPIFIISKEPIPSMWLLDQLDICNHNEIHTYLHQNTETLIQTLQDILQNKIDIDPYKWIFIRK